jgi:type III pantothenate kinase
MERFGIEPEALEGVMIASVVPPVNTTLAQLSKAFFGHEALFVEPGVKTGMPIRYDNPAEVGADRIVNAVAARERWGAPVVVVDFGTATTFDIVSPKGEYVGGVIAPGLAISAEALFSRASRLFRVDIRRPDRLVGKTTAGAMQSGLYWGYVGLVEGILSRLESELPGLERVVATGGQAGLIAAAVPRIDEVEPDLTLEGLRLIWERNR